MLKEEPFHSYHKVLYVFDRLCVCNKPVKKVQNYQKQIREEEVIFAERSFSLTDQVANKELDDEDAHSSFLTS